MKITCTVVDAAPTGRAMLGCSRGLSRGVEEANQWMSAEAHTDPLLAISHTPP